MKKKKQNGSIILPVYPEEQANEKGMWSRSFLENIFTSRTGWTGKNNVWAENDGVMSMRIGKNFPKKPDSTLNFYLDEIGNQFYRDQLIGVAKKTNQEIFEGIYCMYSGPNFETPAEINALKVIGGNAVGMSTVPEVLVANHCELSVIAISVITNLAAGMNKTKLSHKETLENASLAEENILQLIKNFITEVTFDDSSGNN